jgi:hypothetical protein
MLWLPCHDYTRYWVTYPPSNLDIVKVASETKSKIQAAMANSFERSNDGKNARNAITAHSEKREREFRIVRGEW